MSDDDRRHAQRPHRRLILRRSRVYGCSECTWTMASPEVGSYGHRTGKARVASVRGAFASHKCERNQ